MTQSTRKSFKIRPHFQRGHWLTDVDRFAENAKALLSELEDTVADVNAAWPKPLNESVRQDECSSELWKLVRKRDLLSDSTRTFSAMAVEAFLNFYGVVRLGEKEFSSHFEKLGLTPKLRQLLLICDGISLDEKDPIVICLRQLAETRNSLLHPKTKELTGFVSAKDRTDGIDIPSVAQNAVRNMDAFFEFFGEIVPDARTLLPQKHGSI